MTRLELLNTLDYIDNRFGKNIFLMQNLRMFFKNEDEKTFKTSLSRHEKSGIIKRVCKGVYMNPRARSASPYLLESFVKYIRPNGFSYLSLESRLSEEGIISQIPNRLTFMSTGRSQVFKTPYGVIEFVHTKRDRKDIGKDIDFDKSRGIYIASANRALEDLRHTRRNLGLVNLI